MLRRWVYVLGLFLAFAACSVADPSLAQEQLKGNLKSNTIAPPVLAPSVDETATPAPPSAVTQVGDPAEGANCAPGHQRAAGKCIPACEPGFRRVAGYPGLCLPAADLGCPADFDQIPILSCPAGYYRDLDDPDTCIKDSVAAAQASTCGFGMEYSTVRAACVSRCPVGFHLDDTGHCSNTYAETCQKDYQRDMNTGKCLRPGKWPSDYQWLCLPSCPPDAARDMLHPSRCLPPKTTCEPGQEQVGTRCLAACATDAVRNAYGYCEPKVPCAAASYATLRGECRPLQCAEGTELVGAKCLVACATGEVRDAAGTCALPVQPAADCQGTATWSAELLRCVEAAAPSKAAKPAAARPITRPVVKPKPKPLPVNKKPAAQPAKTPALQLTP